VEGGSGNGHFGINPAADQVVVQGCHHEQIEKEASAERHIEQQPAGADKQHRREQDEQRIQVPLVDGHRKHVKREDHERRGLQQAHQVSMPPEVGERHQRRSSEQQHRDSLVREIDAAGAEEQVAGHGVAVQRRKPPDVPRLHRQGGLRREEHVIHMD